MLSRTAANFEKMNTKVRKWTDKENIKFIVVRAIGSVMERKVISYKNKDARNSDLERTADNIPYLTASNILKKINVMRRIYKQVVNCRWFLNVFFPHLLLQEGNWRMVLKHDT